MNALQLLLDIADYLFPQESPKSPGLDAGEILKDEDPKQAAERYRSIVAECQRTKTTYRDVEFPCEGFPAEQKKAFYHRVYDWFRPSQLPPNIEWIRPTQMKLEYWPGFSIPEAKQWTIMDGPKMSDPFQVEVADCGLVSAMACLAEHTDVIGAVVPRKHVSEYGVYEVRLWVYGQWKSVIVDDWFMARQQILIVTKYKSDNRKQLWPSLIEKALAKEFTGYKGLYAISAATSYQWLTGHPTSNYYPKKHSDDFIWETIVNARQSGYPMSVGTRPPKQLEGVDLKAIQGSHYYSLVDVRTWRGHRLVRLRNTWGTNHWTGKWSQRWINTEGTRQDHAELTHKEGTFDASWMAFDDFLVYFNLITVCRLRRSWSSVTVKLALGRGANGEERKAIRMLVREPTLICLSALCLDEHLRNVNHTLFSLVRCDKNTFEPEEVVGCYCVGQVTGSSSRDIALSPGTYLLMVSDVLNWKGLRHIVVHSSRPVTVRLVALDPTLHAQSLQKFIRKTGIPVSFGGNPVPRGVSIKKHWFSGIFFMLMAENYTKDQYFHVCTYNRRNLDRFFLVGGQHELRVDVIPPMSRQVILIQFQRAANVNDHDPVDISIDYYLSSEKVAKVWGLRDEHYPEIHEHRYLMHTFPILGDEMDEEKKKKND